jgi:hypothetical protein
MQTTATSTRYKLDNPIEECPRCLFTSEFATIGQKQCNYCDIHDKLERDAEPDKL